MSDKQVIEAMKAVGEFTEALEESGVKLAQIMKMMDQAMAGELNVWFKGVEAITESSQDDLIGMLIFSASILARVRAMVRDVPAYSDIKELVFSKKEAAGC